MSFVPVWIRMWLGDPSCFLSRSSNALCVVGHQSLVALWFGKSFFSFRNLPFESMRRTMSALSGLLVSCLTSASCSFEVGSVDDCLATESCVLVGPGASGCFLRLVGAGWGVGWLAGISCDLLVGGVGWFVDVGG